MNKAKKLEGNYTQALEKARAEFSKYSPRLLAEKSGVCYHAEEGFIYIRYCNSLYKISYPQGEIQAPDNQMQTSEEVLLLLYLLGSSGIKPRGCWISFAELPHGSHHLVPFLKEAVHPLAACFGSQPARLQEAASLLGGQPLKMGDCGQFIEALPGLTLAMAVWAGDEEFPPRATILYDSVAPLYLDTASLYVLGFSVSSRLRAAAGCA